MIVTERSADAKYKNGSATVLHPVQSSGSLCMSHHTPFPTEIVNITSRPVRAGGQPVKPVKDHIEIKGVIEETQVGTSPNLLHKINSKLFIPLLLPMLAYNQYASPHIHCIVKPPL